MTEPEPAVRPTDPRADRGPDEPHPARLSPDHPLRQAILAAHHGARMVGESTYVDPATGYLVMTSDELAARGRCCRQGCRHCPYLM